VQETLYDSMQQRRSLDPRETEGALDDLVVPASQNLFGRSMNATDQAPVQHVEPITSTDHNKPAAPDHRGAKEKLLDQLSSSTKTVKLSPSPSPASASPRYMEHSSQAESRSLVGALAKSLGLVGAIPGALRRLLFPGHAERPMSPEAPGSIGAPPEEESADLQRQLLLAVMLQQALHSPGSTQQPELLEQLRRTGNITGCADSH
jgi:hypothetical protein